MIYGIGTIGFIFGFFLGQMVLLKILRDVPKEELLDNKKLLSGTFAELPIEPSAKDCKNPVESFHANEHEVQNENEEVTRREISRRDGSRGSVG